MLEGCRKLETLYAIRGMQNGATPPQSLLSVLRERRKVLTPVDAAHASEDKRCRKIRFCSKTRFSREEVLFAANEP